MRVLGGLALIDEGETDWKLLVVDVDAPGAPSWRDAGDIPTERVDELREWFRVYKTAEGKPKNEYSLDGRVVSAEHAMAVAQGTHEHWAQLTGHHSGAVQTKDASIPFASTFKKEGCWLGKPPPLLFRPHDYSNNMGMTAQVTIKGTTQASGRLIAYVGTIVRGVQGAVSKPPFGPYAHQPMYQITMYADADGETLHFVFEREDGGVRIDLADTMTYEVNGMVGTALKPYPLSDVQKHEEL